MSVINSQPLIGASGQAGYFLGRSLRFRSSASAYLSRTPASVGNQQKWTWSSWVKRGSLSGTRQLLFCCANSAGSLYFVIEFDPSNCITIYDSNSGGGTNITTTQVFRDISAYYHITLQVDTTQATASNRIKLYVNGTQVTSFSTANYPPQNSNTRVNLNAEHSIGSANPSPGGLYFDGYMTEINFIDGQALTPSSFGETSASTGVWIPKKYTGTYGTNGFYLDFKDNSALTTSSNAGLGKDNSGNGNYWTTNNISITSGATYDSMTDVPTLTSATAANYCVLNSAAIGTDATISSANLNIAYGSATTRLGTAATIGMTSGKWYWEVEITASSTTPTTAMISLTTKTSPNEIGQYPGVNTSGWAYYGNTGNKFTNDVPTSYGNTYTTNDIIGVAFDADSGKLWFAKNGTWQNSGSPTNGTNEAFSGLTSGPYFAGIGDGGATGTFTAAVNFGQRPFAYTPPSGFVALNTFNLPTPTIGATASSQANKYFDINLWSGNSSTQTITNSNSMPAEFIWIKNRNGTFNHGVFDIVRGASNAIYPSLTNAEGTESGVTAFNSNGFTLGSSNGFNGNTFTYVGWQWRANGAGVTNTAGSITSTVSANTTAGFSIATFTCPSSGNFTVGHGLGVAPAMFILKTRSAVDGWYVYHQRLATPASNYLVLNTTAATASSTSIWGNTNPTSTVLTLGTNAGIAANQTGVLYCFAEVAGYSRFGSYTGNGSTDGPFIFTGFRPRFVMIKRTDTSGNSWLIYDTARVTYNADDLVLYPNLSNAEDSGVPIDVLSNGFKQRTTWTNGNANGGTYIYMALAESPFKYSVAR